MAEILITLMVIAVVATMTIPQLKKHQHKTEFETRLKKAYLTLEQALDAAMLTQHIEQDGIVKWTTNKEFVENIAPELIAAKTCSTSATVSQCMTMSGVTYALVTMDGMSIGANGRTYYVDVNGPNPPNTLDRDIYTFQLQKVNNEWKIVPTGTTSNIQRRGWKITEW